MQTTTIVSQSTPAGFSAISVVRLSGPKSFFFSKKLSNTSKGFKHKTAQYLPVIINETKKIDDAVYIPYFAPKSYTGEDVVEISCHGNPHIVLAIINELLSFGAKLAEPGEYTKRAFLNGKIDLLQAESVSLLIESKSLAAAKELSKNIEGKASKKISSFKREIIKILSFVEFELDVSEDDGFYVNQQKKISLKLKSLAFQFKTAIETFETIQAYTQGAKVVFLGKPNVGKSTLVNKLLNNNKILTSATPGTTRDVISTDITMSGFQFSFVDTAGIHATKNKIEAAGILKTKEEMKNADIIISVFSNDTQAVDLAEDKRVILVYNKDDLESYKGTKKNVFSVSAITGKGTDLLKNKIVDLAYTLKKNNSHPLITTLRQKDSLTKAKESLARAIGLLDQKTPPLELLANELMLSIHQLDITTGKTTTNDVLESVFSSFCVGK